MKAKIMAYVAGINRRFKEATDFMGKLDAIENAVDYATELMEENKKANSAWAIMLLEWAQAKVDKMPKAENGDEQYSLQAESDRIEWALMEAYAE